ncbi:MAG: MATE family efflux transporter [Boseongicola sp.]|nr:MAG: MATE family efflux transporter [Boseongicola sp.]
MSTAETQNRPVPTLANQSRALIALGLPLVGSQLAQVAIQVTDTLMLGWYDVSALAAVSLAGPAFFTVFIVASGFAIAVMPMVASAAGTDDDRQVRRVTRMGLWLTILFGAVLTVPLLFFEEFFLAIGQEPLISELAGKYMDIIAFGLMPALLVMVFRSYLSALELTRIVLYATLATTVLNVALNYALIFGNWGFPELGVEGAAIASVIGHILGALFLCAYALIRTPKYTLFQNFHRPDWDALFSVFKLGWPISLTLLSEVGLFAVASIMMGWVGTISLAAHGIALQIASATFMIHLGLSQAITVRAGRAWGRGDHQTLRLASQSALLVSGGAVVVTIFVFLMFPNLLIGAFIDPTDPDRAEILAIGAILLGVAALFQLVDAAQVMALGMLRGVQDTMVPMIMAAIGYWVVGVPTSYLLGFVFGLDGAGIWLGLSLGLAITAVLLQSRFWMRHAKPSQTS